MMMMMTGISIQCRAVHYWTSSEVDITRLSVDHHPHLRRLLVSIHYKQTTNIYIPIFSRSYCYTVWSLYRHHNVVCTSVTLRIIVALNVDVEGEKLCRRVPACVQNIHQRHGRTDGQTNNFTALCVGSRDKNAR